MARSLDGILPVKVLEWRYSRYGEGPEKELLSVKARSGLVGLLKLNDPAGLVILALKLLEHLCRIWVKLLLDEAE